MRYFLITLLITSLSLGAAAQADCTAARGEPIRLGAVFPPKGLLGTDASDPYRGVQAMVAAVNACGGVNDRPVELVYVPAANYDEAIQAADELSGDVPVIIGSGNATVTVGLSQRGNDFGDFVLWEVTESLDGSYDTPYAFSPRPNDVQTGSLTADYIENQVMPLLGDEALRLAIVYQMDSRALAVLDGMNFQWDRSAVLMQEYDDYLENAEAFSVRVREEDINVLVVVGFDDTPDDLWYYLREADANLDAWIQVGSEVSGCIYCRHVRNTDGLIWVRAAGNVNTDYRLGIIGAVYEQYVDHYQDQFDSLPDTRADLAASGVFTLLRWILPEAGDQITAASVRAAAFATEVASLNGMMGEGWRLVNDSIQYQNQHAAVIFSQRQNGTYCVVAPVAVASCAQGLQRFPTWRERAVAGR